MLVLGGYQKNHMTKQEMLVWESEVIDYQSKKAYFPKSKFKLPESATKVVGLFKIGEDSEDPESEEFGPDKNVVKVLVVYLDKKS